MSGSGMAATLPILPLSPLYNRQLASSFDFSLEKSTTMLDNAGIKDYNSNGYREIRLAGDPIAFELDFIVNNESAVKVSAAREIAKSLESIGIAVNLRELSWSDYQKALEDGNFDMYYAEVRLTPDFDLSPFLIEGGRLNFGKITGSSYAEHIGNYLAASDEDRNYYADLMCSSITDTAPLIPIAFERKQVLTHLGTILGMVPTQYNIFNKFADWTIKFNTQIGD